MMEEDWNDTFYDLFREAVGRYHEGHRNVDGFVDLMGYVKR